MSNLVLSRPPCYRLPYFRNAIDPADWERDRMDWVIYFSDGEGELTPWFKAHSHERAVELVEQFCQGLPNYQVAMYREDALPARLKARTGEWSEAEPYPQQSN